MTFLSLIAATFTFSATATGVEKGAPVEFFLVGNGSDRDYETMFLLDEDVGGFCRRLESAGLPRGKPENPRDGFLWPIGCKIELNPALEDFIDVRLPDGLEPAPVVYTGGRRLSDGSCEATTNMPLSVFSFYSLAQSPLVYAASYGQSAVYNCFHAKKKLAKGTRVDFTLSWDEKTLPKPLSMVIQPGNAKEVLKSLREASRDREIEVLVDFSPELTVAESKAAADALSVIDSRRVKVNGSVEGHLYFRAFQPLVKWLDRQERLVQPFELTVGSTNTLVYIESDWNVDGLDPRLIPHTISAEEAKQHKDVDTCFIYVSQTSKLEQVYKAMEGLKGSSVRTWYVFAQDNTSLHNSSCAK